MIARAAIFAEHMGELRILLVKSSSGTRYVYPGGHTKHGETVTAAARRETSEEAGYTPVGWGERSEAYHGKDGPVEMVVFKGAYCSGTGEREARWYPLEAAERMLRLERSPGEGDAMVKAMWAAVKRYRGETGPDAVPVTPRVIPPPC